MPDFSFRLPRFLRPHRSRRSHSPKPSPAGARNDAAASPAPHLSPSPALSFRPSSTHGTPELAVDVATGTSISPAQSDQTHPQEPTGRRFVDRTQDASGQSLQVIEPVTPINAVKSNAVPKINSQDTVAEPLVHLTHPPTSAGSTQSMHPLDLTATLRQQSLLISDQQSVSPCFKITGH
jgi:hypothetical protein